jgi:hypothetical protein
MNEIIALTMCVAPYVSSTNLKHLNHLILALLCISGGATTVGLSRWSGKSCRTLQRWYQAPLDWAMLLWILVRSQVLNAEAATSWQGMLW